MLLSVDAFHIHIMRVLHLLHLRTRLIQCAGSPQHNGHNSGNEGKCLTATYIQFEGSAGNDLASHQALVRLETGAQERLFISSVALVGIEPVVR